MEGQTNLYGFNGNVLVSKDGNVIYKKSFGFADYNTKRKLDSNSIFDCGSIAKEFTAMGILLLKDKGKISYIDTLRKFFVSSLNRLTSKPAKMDIRQPTLFPFSLPLIVFDDKAQAAFDVLLRIPYCLVLTKPFGKICGANGG